MNKINSYREVYVSVWVVWFQVYRFKLFKLRMGLRSTTSVTSERKIEARIIKVERLKFSELYELGPTI